MMYLANTGTAFAPANDEALALHRKLEAGEIVLCEVKRIRSLRMHRMYFGICGEIGKNQDPPRSASSIDLELRVRAGHFDVLPLNDAPVEVRVPRRIAFDKLDHDAWMALWPSFEQAIAEHFGAEYLGGWST